MDASGMQVLQQLHRIISGSWDKHILQMAAVGRALTGRASCRQYCPPQHH